MTLDSLKTSSVHLRTSTFAAFSAADRASTTDVASDDEPMKMRGRSFGDGDLIRPPPQSLGQDAGEVPPQFGMIVGDAGEGLLRKLQGDRRFDRADRRGPLLVRLDHRHLADVVGTRADAHRPSVDADLDAARQDEVDMVVMRVLHDQIGAGRPKADGAASTTRFSASGFLAKNGFFSKARIAFLPPSASNFSASMPSVTPLRVAMMAYYEIARGTARLILRIRNRSLLACGKSGALA